MRTNDTFFLQAFQPIRQAPILFGQRPDLGNLSSPCEMMMRCPARTLRMVSLNRALAS